MSSLIDVYTLLRDHFGPLTGPEAIVPWWPIFGDDPPFEMLVGAVLVQQTRWETVEAAILRLLALDLLCPAALIATDPVSLGASIRPAAFYTQKAPGLIAIAHHLCVHYDGSTARMLAQPIATLRPELLALPRIGRETCDVILLYGGGHPVFVIDEYTRRLFERVRPAECRMQNAECRRPDANHRIDTDPCTQPDAQLWRAPYEKLRAWMESELEPRACAQASTIKIQSLVGPQPAARPQLMAPAQAPTASSQALAALYADYHAQMNEVCVRYCLTRPRCDGPPARRVYSRQEGRVSYLDRDDGCPLRPVCAFYQNR